MKWLWLVLLCSSIGCSRNNYEDDDRMRPCDPRGSSRVEPDEIEDVVERQAMTVRVLAESLATCEELPQLDVNANSDVLRMCTAATPAAGCRLHCVAEYEPAVAMLRGQMAHAVLAEMPTLVQRKAECVGTSDAGECLARELGVSAGRWLSVRPRLDEGKLLLADVSVRVNLDRQLDMRGFWESGGCDTGMVWSTQLNR